MLGLFTPVAAAGALAYLITGLLADAMAAHEDARLASFLTDGHEYKIILVVRGRGLILTGPGATASMPVAAGRAARSSGRSPRWCSVSVPASRLWVLLNGGNPLASPLAVRVGHPARAGLGQLRQRREGHRREAAFPGRF